MILAEASTQLLLISSCLFSTSAFARVRTRPTGPSPRTEAFAIEQKTAIATSPVDGLPLPARFALPQGERVRLTVYDLSGKLVRVRLDEVKAAGSYGVQPTGGAGVLRRSHWAARARRTETYRELPSAIHSIPKAPMKEGGILTRPTSSSSRRTTSCGRSGSTIPARRTPITCSGSRTRWIAGGRRCSSPTCQNTPA